MTISCGKKKEVLSDKNQRDYTHFDWRKDTTDPKQHVDYMCKIESIDSIYKLCDCSEYIFGTDTLLSHGKFSMDTLNQILYRHGWHEYYDVKGNIIQRLRHVMLTLDGGKILENVSEVITYDSKGDTIFEKSSYFDLIAPDTITLGSEYPVEIRFHSRDPNSRIFYWLNIDEYEKSSMDSGRTNLHNFTYKFTPKDTGHFRFSGFFREFEDVKGTDSLDMFEMFLWTDLFVKNK